MVVIKAARSELNNTFGASVISRLWDFADIIGYSVEESDGEVRVEFNPDRPDLYSFAALNRAMKCFYDKDYWIIPNNSKPALVYKISDNVLSLRKYMTAFVAEGKPISGNLDHLIAYQERIHDNIGKNRSKVSIGLHDMDKLKPPFEFKAVQSRSIRFTTYDGTVSGSAVEILKKHPKGQEYSELIPSDDKVPIILDSEGDVLSLPPVINGVKSKVEEITRRFFVDITGNDSKATREAYYLLSYEFRNMGYSIFPVDTEESEADVIRKDNSDGRSIEIENIEMKKITGISLSQDKTITLLRRMGYMAEPSATWIKVRVPGNRIDVMGPVDVFEDAIKAYGIANLTEKKMNLPLIGNSNHANDFANLVRDAMVGMGIQEVRTFVVSSADHYGNAHYRGGFHVINPKSQDYSVIRDRLHINMLELLRINKRRPLPHRIFEIGDIYEEGEQRMRVCAMIMDSKAGYSSIKQVLDNIALRLGYSSVTVQEHEAEGFIAGRSGYVYFDGKMTGIIGEVSPETLTSFDLAAPVAALELDFSALLQDE